MPIKEDLTSGISAVKVEVSKVKELLKMVQFEVCTNTEAINALNSKVDEVQHPVPVPEPSFTDTDRQTLYWVAKFNLLQAEALSNLEFHTKDLSQRLNDLTSSLADDKEGEKDMPIEEPKVKASHAMIPHHIGIEKDEDDVVIAHSIDEDLPITSTINVGDEDSEEEEDDDHEDLPLLDAGRDLGEDDDDEDDDDDFTIQYHTRPVPA
ncbi:UPF0415 protein C7orf25 homolog [Cynara cardunculus var. scolymus]|uniref:UPF0415 protein C7orf25 homolog n=1 Tax=Cynara cardunculus var. scolymus TaxID=59895 RepID=UPI000D629814|nr:UPF0415 protein C7orf25 homolog [Cynara cardunculus var. scolymus]